MPSYPFLHVQDTRNDTMQQQPKAQTFSLNDQDVKDLVQAASRTEDPGVLRDAIYKLVQLRKEMAARLGGEQRARKDLQRIAKDVSDLLGRETNRALSFLFDRTGSVESLRAQLKTQLDANLNLANELRSVRAHQQSTSSVDPQELQRLSSALAQANEQVRVLEEEIARANSRLASLEPIQEELMAERRKVMALTEQLAELTEQQSLFADAPAAASLDTPVQMEAQSDAQAQIAQARIEHLTAELQSAQERIAQLERTRMQAPVTAAPGDELTAVQELFSQQFAGVIADKMRLERVTSEQQGTIDSLNTQMDEISIQLEAKSTGLAQAQQELQAAEHRLTDQRQTVARLEERAAQLESQIGTLQSNAIGLEGTIAKLDGQLNDSSIQHAQELARLNGELELTREKLSAAIGETKKVERDAIEFMEQIEQLKRSESGLQNDLTRTRFEAESLTRQVEQKTSELSLLTAERDSIGQALIAANAQIDTLNKSVGSLTTRNGELENMLTDAQGELKKLLAQAESVEREALAARDELNQQIAAQNQHIQQLNEEISFLKGDLAAAEKQIGRLELRTTKLHEGLTAASKARDLYYREAASMSLELRQATKGLSALQERLNQSESMNSRLKSDLVTSQKVIQLERPLSIIQKPDDNSRGYERSDDAEMKV
ncbi:hypothetical protein [Geopseudomonas aromaticivorans]